MRKARLILRIITVRQCVENATDIHKVYGADAYDI